MVAVGSQDAMVEIGYTAMCEQTPVKHLVSNLAGAEAAGFDFSVIADDAAVEVVRLVTVSPINSGPV